MTEEKKKKYNKWVSRRWLVAVFLMLLLGGCLLGNAFIGLSDVVLVSLITFVSSYLMLFTKYQSKEKSQRKDKENGS